MKYRMHNVFYRYIKVDLIAKVITNCSYWLLKSYYLVARLFLINKKNNIDLTEKQIDNAKEHLTNKEQLPISSLVIDNQPLDDSIILSIIMPAYNVEKYIRESIESVVGQNTKYKYELIIVNDGSTDSTLEIIKSINDSHIRIISQENQGLSGARNTGLNHAKGRFVFFIDSDDILEQDSIDKLLEAIIDNDADISIGSFYLFYDDNNAKQIVKVEDKILENNTREIISNPGFAWGKVYKRDLFYNVRFPLGMWFEDTIICSVIFRECKRMACISESVYGYRQNQSGISKQSKKNYKSLDHIWVMEDAINQAHNIDIEDDEFLYELCFGHFSSLLYRRIMQLDEETKRNAFIVACDIMKKMTTTSNKRMNRIERDIEFAFKNGNYKLWKLASFVV